MFTYSMTTSNEYNVKKLTLEFPVLDESDNPMWTDADMSGSTLHPIGTGM